MWGEALRPQVLTGSILHNRNLTKVQSTKQSFNNSGTGKNSTIFGRTGRYSLQILADGKGMDYNELMELHPVHRTMGMT